MPARFIPIGESAHDAERQALHFLVEGLPADYTIYGNPWLVERSGVIYEIDAVVVAPHAIYVVEIKSYRGKVYGTDHDWYVPDPIRSPLKLNRKTAQVLAGRLRRENYEAGRAWVEGFVFLSAAAQVDVRGPASLGRVHTRTTVLGALQDAALARRLSGREQPAPTSPAAASEVYRILTGARQQGPRPARRIREYVVEAVLDRGDRATELLARNALAPDIVRVLRVYAAPPLATDEQLERVESRARWEAQVLGRLGRHAAILDADPPFSDDGRIILPF